MGAKASTANNGAGHQSPRARTFSTSSSSDVVSTGTGFNLLRAIPGMHVGGGGNSASGGGGGGSVIPNNDRMRARSLSSVPDLQARHLNNHEAISIPSGAGQYDEQIAGSGGGGGGSGSSNAGNSISNIDGNSVAAAASAAATAGAIALGRVYTATSLPSHIWSLNGKSVYFAVT